jgi:hypothetical protein
MTNQGQILDLAAARILVEENSRLTAECEALVDGMTRIMRETRMGDPAFAIACEVVGELSALSKAVPPSNCRQRLAAEGKPYPRSSCDICGQFSPKWRECNGLIDASKPEAERA